MKYFSSLFFSIIVLGGCDQLPSANKSSKGANENSDRPPVHTLSNADLPQHIQPVPIPKVVTFAGEVIPVERADVREALEEELMVNAFRHSHTLAIIKNVARWKPFVVDILKSLDVPEDFLYLAVIESEFDNNALSYAGAAGMWQIMKETAKDYGLIMTNDIDMRRDPKLSTIAAGKFLKWSYSNLNNWTMTAASYNAGMKGMKDRLRDQKVNSFFDLHLNSETARYVYRIIALKLILENPEAYGYFVPDEEKYQPYQFTTVHVNDDINNLVDFAQQYNTTYKELRILNPWFNNTSNFKLNIPKNESLEIRIPKQ
ncbi:MAG TPA: lytic transglycosylase domain-containing protein [Cytophagaceae bacterium]